jgi:hypothetical protein
MKLQIHQPREEARTRHKPQPAREGRGPLLQRDFIGVFESAPCSPEAVMDRVRREFPRFSPDLLASFARCREDGEPLELGDEMEVTIRGMGCHKVRAVGCSERMLTLRTIEAHPEAGRISFGCFLDARGRMIFRIRSRARINNLIRLAGYWMGGMSAQTAIWRHFIESVAQAIGTRVEGQVVVAQRFVEDSRADLGVEDAPTFPPR